MKKFKRVGWAAMSLALAVVVGFALAGAVRAYAAGASVQLSSQSGPPGSVTQVQGGGFTPNETVNIFIGSTMGTPVATSFARGDSLFGPVSVTIPPYQPAGTALISAVGASSSLSASAQFTVSALSPSIVIPTSTANTPGSVIQGQLSGFIGGEGVTVTLSTATATTTVDGGGNGTVSLTIPNVSAGSYVVKAVGQSSHAQATTYFYVGAFYPSVTISQYYALPGQALTFTGNGFAPNETIDVFGGGGSATSSASSSLLVSFNADGTGAFTNAGSFSVPFSFANTSQTLMVRGRVSGASATVPITVGAYYPAITPSSYFLQRGDSFMVTGNNFAPNESVAISMFGFPSASFFSDASGTLVAGPFTVSPGASSTLLITATAGMSGGVATTTITIGNTIPQQVVTSTLTIFVVMNNPSSTSSGATSTATSTTNASTSFAVPSDFTFTVYGNASATPATFTGDASGTVITLNGDTDFSLGVTGGGGAYTPHWVGTCNGGVPSGTNDTCTVTEAFMVPTIDITPATLSDAVLNGAYSTTLTASTTATGPFMWTTSGTLPPGITLDTSSTAATATLSGTATATGTYPFMVTVSSGFSSATQAFTLNIDATAPAPPTSGGSGGGGGITVIVGGGSGGGGGLVTGGGSSGAVIATPATPLAPNTGVGEVLGASTVNTADMPALRTQLLALEQQLIGLQMQGTNSCTAQFTQNLSVGARGGEVLALQRALNASGLTTVAASGPGSPGKETMFFGPSTRKAVMAFQTIFANDVLEPSGLAVATGYVGPATRAKLNTLCSGAANQNGTTVSLR